MQNNPMLAQASLDEKNAMYQVWVGAGTYMLGWQSNLAKHPNAQQQAKMQQAGAQTLRSLGIEPDKVRFTAKGMEFH